LLAVESGSFLRDAGPVGALANRVASAMRAVPGVVEVELV